jgi:hypothetical protein
MQTLKILVTSQKGGVGKSTIAANLAAFFRKSKNLATTLIDFDPHGSSSSWVNRSAPLGVVVQHYPLPVNLGKKRALLEGRTHLRHASQASAVVVADLTWTDATDEEILYDYDLVLTPVSLSAIEVAATITFLHRLHWVFDTTTRLAPQLVICPSRVDDPALIEPLFTQQRFPISFLLAPPILTSAEARNLFEKGYLIDLPDGAGRSFVSFAQAVADAGQRQVQRRAQAPKTPRINDIQQTHGASDVLNRFMKQQNTRTTQASQPRPTPASTLRPAPPAVKQGFLDRLFGKE